MAEVFMAARQNCCLLACDTVQPGIWASKIEKYTAAECWYNPTALHGGKGHTLNRIYCLYYSQKGKEYVWHF